METNRKRSRGQKSDILFRFRRDENVDFRNARGRDLSWFSTVERVHAVEANFLNVWVALNCT